MHTKEQLMDMQTEHNEWQNKIRFYKTELKKLNEQLAEFVTRNTSSRVMASIEHFQNQFTIQNEVLDIMRHDFKQHENAIEAKHSNLHVAEKKLLDEHESHIERLAQFEKIFQELRNEFNDFTQKEPQY